VPPIRCIRARASCALAVSTPSLLTGSPSNGIVPCDDWLARSSSSVPTLGSKNLSCTVTLAVTVAPAICSIETTPAM
jgi:hypothetical protein